MSGAGRGRDGRQQPSPISKKVDGTDQKSVGRKLAPTTMRFDEFVSSPANTNTAAANIPRPLTPDSPRRMTVEELKLKSAETLHQELKDIEGQPTQYSRNLIDMYSRVDTLEGATDISRGVTVKLKLEHKSFSELNEYFSANKIATEIKPMEAQLAELKTNIGLLRDDVNTLNNIRGRFLQDTTFSGGRVTAQQVVEQDRARLGNDVTVVAKQKILKDVHEVDMQVVRALQKIIQDEAEILYKKNEEEVKSFFGERIKINEESLYSPNKVKFDPSLDVLSLNRLLAYVSFMLRRLDNDTITRIENELKAKVLQLQVASPVKSVEGNVLVSRLIEIEDKTPKPETTEERVIGGIFDLAAEAQKKFTAATGYTINVVSAIRRDLSLKLTAAGTAFVKRVDEHAQNLQQVEKAHNAAIAGLRTAITEKLEKPMRQLTEKETEYKSQLDQMAMRIANNLKDGVRRIRALEEKQKSLKKRIAAVGEIQKQINERIAQDNKDSKKSYEVKSSLTQLLTLQNRVQKELHGVQASVDEEEVVGIMDELKKFLAEKKEIAATYGKSTKLSALNFNFLRDQVRLLKAEEDTYVAKNKTLARKHKSLKAAEEAAEKESTEKQAAEEKARIESESAASAAATTAAQLSSTTAATTVPADVSIGIAPERPGSPSGSEEDTEAGAATSERSKLLAPSSPSTSPSPSPPPRDGESPEPIPLKPAGSSVPRFVTQEEKDAKDIERYAQACTKYIEYLESVVRKTVGDNYRPQKSGAAMLAPLRLAPSAELGEAKGSGGLVSADALLTFYADKNQTDDSKIQVNRALNDDGRERLREALDKYRVMKALFAITQHQSDSATVRKATFLETIAQPNNVKILTTRRDSNFVGFLKFCGTALLMIFGLATAGIGSYYAYRSFYGSRATEGSKFIHKFDDDIEAQHKDKTVKKSSPRNGNHG